MNDYFKQIKDNEPKQIRDQEDGDFYLLFVPENWDKVIDAANKMAADIDTLEKANSGLAEQFGGLMAEIVFLKEENKQLKQPITYLSDLQVQLYNAKDLNIRYSDKIKRLEDRIITIHANYYKTLDWHEKEIARLKSELAERPDVVFCSECQIVRGMEDDCAWCGFKSHHDKIKNPYKEFCSRGVRMDIQKREEVRSKE